MTQTKPAANCHEAVSSNSEHQALFTESGAKRREADRIRRDTRSRFFDLRSLLLAADLCGKNAFSETTAEQDETLEQITGEDGEVWGWNWHRAEQAIHTAAAAICAEIAQAEAGAKALEAEADALNAKREELAVTIRRQWHEAREALPKTEAA